MTAKTILALAQAHRKEPSQANYDALASAVRALVAERDGLKRSVDLATKRMQESAAYCIELRERLNKYEPGAPMHLNAMGANP